MPGDYGPAGKWIHDRAHRIMQEGDTKDEYGKKKGKSVAYAIAVQQAHKLGKSPKDFRTPTGVHEAKQKYDEPKAEYQKTAMWAAFFDEIEKIGQEPGSLLGQRGSLGAGGAGAQASMSQLTSGGGLSGGGGGMGGGGLGDLGGGGGLDTVATPKRSGALSTGGGSGGNAAAGIPGGLSKNDMPGSSPF